MRRSERRALRELYDFCCGYCGTTEIDAGGKMACWRPLPIQGVFTSNASG
jgi:hypothetical protein